MYIVITTVEIQPGKVDEVKELFSKTNPALVENQNDWVKAKFTADRANNKVVVLAWWRNTESYKTFSGSDTFKNVMGQFMPYFSEPPQVSIVEVLYEM